MQNIVQTQVLIASNLNFLIVLFIKFNQNFWFVPELEVLINYPQDLFLLTIVD